MKVHVNAKTFLKPLILATLVLAGCSSPLDGVFGKAAAVGNAGGRATLSVSADLSPAARTVMPVKSDVEEIVVTKYVLLGGTSGSQVQLAEFSTLTGASVQLGYGGWSFTLDAYSGVNRILSGSLASITVSASGPASLAFTLSPLATGSGTGTIALTINLPAGHAVASVATSLDGSAQAAGLTVLDLSSAQNKVSFTKSGVASGNHPISISLKDGSGSTVANVPEYARVHDFLISKATIDLDLAAFNSAPLVPTNLTATYYPVLNIGYTRCLEE